MVELLAVGIMLSSVFVVFWLVLRQQEQSGTSIGPRHIQFVSVCLIVPTILILGLEQVLSKETTATLIGGLTGYLLSGLGRYEPRKPGDDDKTDGDDDETRKNPGSGPHTPSPVTSAPVTQPVNPTLKVEEPETAKTPFNRRVPTRYEW